MSDLQTRTKTFFERPEGKTGMFFILAGLLAGGWGLFLALPFIITLLTNTLHAMILAGVIAFLVFLVSDKRIRALASYAFKSSMRFLTGLIVEIDPIGILRGYAEDLHKRLDDMTRSMANLEGQKRKLKALIEKNEADRIHSLQVAKLAHDRPDQKAAFVLQSRQAGRLQKSNLTLQALYNKMEALSKAMKKMREVSEFTIQDIEGEIEVKAQERAAIQAGYGAFTAARRILQGDADQRAIFDQAMEHLADDYAMKIGEIEQFMDMSEGFIKSVDLENGVYEQDALSQFEQWEQKADQLMLSPADKVRVPELGQAEEYDDAVEANSSARAGSGFSDLFDQKR